MGPFERCIDCSASIWLHTKSSMLVGSRARRRFSYR
ncbi:hypothetical protein PC128_g24861 [Phytophthora cactorum]|nr:hypothetical protein PC128_g24861 [Phytophthora cactorum]